MAVELIKTIYSLVIDLETWIAALQIAKTVAAYMIIIGILLLIQRDYLEDKLYSKLSCRGGLWLQRLVAEIHFYSSKFLHWISPRIYPDSGNDNDYNRACTKNPTHLLANLKELPTLILRPTPFKILIFLLTLWHFEPYWYLKIYDSVLPHFLIVTSSLWHMFSEYFEQAGKILATVSVFLSGAALYKAMARRKEDKLTRALELNEQLGDSLREIRYTAHHNINMLHHQLKRLPRDLIKEGSQGESLYFLPTRPLRHPSLLIDSLLSRYQSFDESLAAIREILRAVRKERLETEFYWLNRAALEELFKLGLSNEEAAGHLPDELLSATCMQKLYAHWASDSFTFEGDLALRENKIRQEAKNVLAHAISCDIMLSYFLKRSGKINIITKGILKLTTCDA
jgi:hypothetical protein